MPTADTSTYLFVAEYRMEQRAQSRSVIRRAAPPPIRCTVVEELATIRPDKG
jgi:hypothetical protein